METNMTPEQTYISLLSSIAVRNSSGPLDGMTCTVTDNGYTREVATSKSWLQRIIDSKIIYDGIHVPDTIEPLVLPVGFDRLARMLNNSSFGKGFPTGVLSGIYPVLSSAGPKTDLMQMYRSHFPKDEKERKFLAYCFEDVRPMQIVRRYTDRKPYLNVGTIGHIDYDYHRSGPWSMRARLAEAISTINNRGIKPKTDSEIRVSLRTRCNDFSNDPFGWLNDCVTSYHIEACAVNYTAPNIFEGLPTLSEIVNEYNHKAKPTGPERRAQWQRKDGRAM